MAHEDADDCHTLPNSAAKHTALAAEPPSHGPLPLAVRMNMNPRSCKIDQRRPWKCAQQTCIHVTHHMQLTKSHPEPHLCPTCRSHAQYVSAPQISRSHACG